MSDVEKWREDFECLSKAKGLSVERKQHTFVDVAYYVNENTLWLWSGYLEGRRANAAHCELGDLCNCGGDVPAVREGCSRWVRA